MYTLNWHVSHYPTFHACLHQHTHSHLITTQNTTFTLYFTNNYTTLTTCHLYFSHIQQITKSTFNTTYYYHISLYFPFPCTSPLPSQVSTYTLILHIFTLIFHVPFPHNTYTNILTNLPISQFNLLHIPYTLLRSHSCNHLPPRSSHSTILPVNTRLLTTLQIIIMYFRVSHIPHIHYPNSPSFPIAFTSAPRSSKIRTTSM